MQTFVSSTFWNEPFRLPLTSLQPSFVLTDCQKHLNGRWVRFLCLRSCYKDPFLVTTLRTRSRKTLCQTEFRAFSARGLKTELSITELLMWAVTMVTDLIQSEHQDRKTLASLINYYKTEIIEKKKRLQNLNKNNLIFKFLSLSQQLKATESCLYTL